MSKATRIRQLYDQGIFSTREIADFLGCSIEYVRVCARQRKNGANSEADKKWRLEKYGSMQAYYAAMNSNTAEYRRIYYRNRYRDDPEFRRRELARARRNRLRAEMNASN